MAGSGRCALRAASTDLVSVCVELFALVPRVARKECRFDGGGVWAPGLWCSGMMLVVLRDVELKSWVGRESRKLIVLRGDRSKREGFELSESRGKGKIGC